MLGVQQPALSEMFYDGPSVFKTAEGYRRADEASANNAQNLADAIQQHQFESQMNPLRLQGKQQELDKGALEYQLAQAKQPKLLSEAAQIPFNDKNFSALMSHFEGLGDIAAKNGGLPLPIALQLKQSGFPQEVLDELSTPEGAIRVRDAGKSFRENSAKWQLQQSKQGSAEAIAETKGDTQAAAIAARERQAQLDRESRERIAQARLDSARKLMADKRAAAKDKLSLQNYAVDLDKAANSIAIDNPEAANVLKQRRDWALAQAAKIGAAGSQPKVDLQRDLYGELGIIKPTQPAQAAPAAPAPASQDNDPLGIRKK